MTLLEPATPLLSISAALGMAVAAERKGETKRQTIAIIGDGALTGGMGIRRPQQRRQRKVKPPGYPQR
jgi:TPP-dependent 2-oxoacid decarboxylase